MLFREVQLLYSINAIQLYLNIFRKMVSRGSLFIFSFITIGKKDP